MKRAHEARKKVGMGRMIAFGEAGNAGKIKHTSLVDMAKSYGVK